MFRSPNGQFFQLYLHKFWKYKTMGMQGEILILIITLNAEKSIWVFCKNIKTKNAEIPFL